MRFIIERERVTMFSLENLRGSNSNSKIKQFKRKTVSLYCIEYYLDIKSNIDRKVDKLTRLVSIKNNKGNFRSRREDEDEEDY